MDIDDGIINTLWNNILHNDTENLALEKKFNKEENKWKNL